MHIAAAPVAVAEPPETPAQSTSSVYTLLANVEEVVTLYHPIAKLENVICSVPP